MVFLSFSGRKIGQEPCPDLARSFGITFSPKDLNPTLSVHDVHENCQRKQNKNKNRILAEFSTTPSSAHAAAADTMSAPTSCGRPVWCSGGCTAVVVCVKMIFGSSRNSAAAAAPANPRGLPQGARAQSGESQPRGRKLRSSRAPAAGAKILGKGVVSVCGSHCSTSKHPRSM